MAIIVLLVVAVGAYQLLTRSNRSLVAVGPQGRWWWAKLLVGLVVSAAILYALVWFYARYRHTT